VAAEVGVAVDLMAQLAGGGEVGLEGRKQVGGQPGLGRHADASP
jgi:hypothetical protein